MIWTYTRRAVALAIALLVVVILWIVADTMARQTGTLWRSPQGSTKNHIGPYHARTLCEEEAAQGTSARRGEDMDMCIRRTMLKINGPREEYERLYPNG